MEHLALIGVCASGLVGLLSLGLHSSVTDVVRMLASTIMGDGLHSMWVVGFGGIWVLKLSGNFTETERGTSYTYKHICPSPPVFNSETKKNYEDLGFSTHKICILPSLFFRNRRIILTRTSNETKVKCFLGICQTPGRDTESLSVLSLAEH